MNNNNDELDLKTLKGLFITFEGPEGSGKTTVSKKIAELLAREGYVVSYTREPGGSDIAEEIRNIILDVNNKKMDSRTEALLYAASRRQHLIEKIFPALKNNEVVICDRFLDSSLAYQGYARGLGIQEVLDINSFAIENKYPDLTIYCDINPTLGLQRIYANKKREINRLDLEVVDFHYKVQEGYKEVINKYQNKGRNFVTIDASKELNEVINASFAIVLQAVKEHYESTN
ncbi:MAG: dTMP kinase [Bacillales bacterium]|jgi:dTMP kinase|nr:dTMP kinase [Bacillales bacterium]